MSRIGWMAPAAGQMVGADEPGQDGAAKELEAIQGQWTMVSFEVNGEAVPEEQVKTGRLLVKGDKYTPTLGDRSVTFTMVLDPSKSPRTIDLTADEGPNKGQSVKGIYKREGDTFTMCRGVTAEAERPLEFTTGAESGHSLVVWRRAKGAG